jgi:hypothetical protein
VGLLDRWDQASQRRAEAQMRLEPSPYPISDRSFADIVLAVHEGRAVEPDLAEYAVDRTRRLARAARIELAVLLSVTVAVAAVVGVWLGESTIDTVGLTLVSTAAVGSIAWWSSSLRMNRRARRANLAVLGLAQPPRQGKLANAGCLTLISGCWFIVGVGNLVAGLVTRSVGQMVWGLALATLWGAWLTAARIMND